MDYRGDGRATGVGTKDAGHIQGTREEFSCVAVKLFSRGPLAEWKREVSHFASFLLLN